MNEIEHLQSFVDELKLLCRRTLEDLSTLDEDGLLAFSTKREELVQAMKPYGAAATNEIKEQIRGILQEEQAILARMMEIKQEAAEWLQKRGMIRAQQHAYQQSYAANSLFFDNRK
ncbi:hypothetical protein MMB75_12235 [Paenibacillus sp. P2(2022)]|uniref:hypothetical protein n=1 Tax=Paenibacillus TaxID=44249 RepID=UPI0005ED1DB8|nr:MULTISPECIES: hypothetical protein [Paenibacillus]KJK29948.1 hypothetical protein TY89_13305 [Paenibacillus polymyxa]MDG0054440.1 hypothetical protein [Paenibacillus sp. P2(2022)]